MTKDLASLFEKTLVSQASAAEPRQYLIAQAHTQQTRECLGLLSPALSSGQLRRTKEVHAGICSG